MLSEKIGIPSNFSQHSTMYGELNYTHVTYVFPHIIHAWIQNQSALKTSILANISINFISESPDFNIILDSVYFWF